MEEGSRNLKLENCRKATFRISFGKTLFITVSRKRSIWFFFFKNRTLRHHQFTVMACSICYNRLKFHIIELYYNFLKLLKCKYMNYNYHFPVKKIYQAIVASFQSLHDRERWNSPITEVGPTSNSRKSLTRRKR